MVLPSFLTGQLWKIATGGAAILSIILSVLLVTSYIENRDIAKQRDELARRIDDPVTGYVAKLAQSQTNVVQLKTTIDEQNEAYKVLAAKSRSDLKTAEAKLELAQARALAAEKRVAGFLATKPQGATLEQRIQDIDRRALEELVQ